MPETAIQQLARHEGLRLRPYKCSAGKLTIGYGHNLDDKPISERAAMVQLEDDLQDSKDDLARTFPWYSELHPDAQRVLENMCFNLGISRLSGFVRMFGALERGDYRAAAKEMLSSKWAVQVGSRATELAGIMAYCSSLP